MPSRQTDGRDQWSRANMKEILPELPSPLFMFQLEMSSGPRMLAAFEIGGYRFPDGAMLFRTAAGRPYFNTGLLRSMLADLGAPPELNDQAIGSGVELDRPALQWNWPRVARRLPVVLSNLVRQLRAVPATERWFGRVEGTLAELSLATDRVLRRAADADVLADFERIAPEMGRFFYHTGYLTAAATTHFTSLLRVLHGRLEAPAAAINQAVAGEGNVSADLPLALMRVAAIARTEPPARTVLTSSSDLGADFRDTLRGTRTLTHFERILDRFGDRGLFESDSASPRYREDAGLPARCCRAVCPRPHGSRRRRCGCPPAAAGAAGASDHQASRGPQLAIRALAPRSLAPSPRPARGQPLSGCADRRPSAPARAGAGTADGRARLARPPGRLLLAHHGGDSARVGAGHRPTATGIRPAVCGRACYRSAVGSPHRERRPASQAICGPSSPRAVPATPATVPSPCPTNVPTSTRSNGLPAARVPPRRVPRAVPRRP